jgi:phytoene desaturase
MKQRVVVIGAGFGGLAAACRLAALGYSVELFDKRDKLGGRGYQYDINGFKFDGGPTVITVPYMFDEIFDLAGRKREDYFSLTQLDPFYRIFNHEGRHFDYHRETEDNLASIREWNAGDQEGYKRFLAGTEKIFDSFGPFTDKTFLRFSDMLKILPQMVKLNAMAGTHGYVSRFIKDDFLRQVFSFHPLLIGGNPLDTPAIYTLIAQFEKRWGVLYAMGGTGAIVQGLGRLFTELGGKIHLNTEVREILVEGRLAKGVRLADGTKVAADAVISNGDPAFTYLNLIPARARRTWTNFRIEKLSKYSMSLFVIYFGTNRRYTGSKLKHHNIIVGKNYKGLLKDVFKDGGALPEEMALYLHMPTRTDASVAPEGCESFYVLAPAPNLGSVDWTTQAKPYRDRIMQFLQDNYLPDVQQHIVAEHTIDPLHFQNTLNSHRGAAFSLQPTLMQSAWMRPHNRAEDFDNLYFCGAGTHPGAGIPSVLSSGKIAARLVHEAAQAQTRAFGTPAYATAVR